MPEKDGSDDKKSTKSVVSKKEKQFMNKEQLDLSNVAESFGGQIVGEPVELDELADGGVFSIPTAALIAKYGIPLAIAGIGAAGTYLNRKQLGQTFKNMFGGSTTTADDIIWRDDGIGKDNINPNNVDAKKDGDVNVNNNKDLVVPGSTTKDLTRTNVKDLTRTNVGTNVKAQEISTTKTNTKTRRLPKPFKMNLPKIPGTPHNVGRRVNPQ